MSDTPERIWLDLKSDSEVWTWNGNDAFPQDVCFIRADLHDDLVKAADALASAAADVDKSRGKVWALEAHDRMMIALTAYRKAKEKMNAL